MMMARSIHNQIVKNFGSSAANICHVDVMSLADHLRGKTDMAPTLCWCHKCFDCSDN